jgi:hypothetical protein
MGRVADSSGWHNAAANNAGSSSSSSISGVAHVLLFLSGPPDISYGRTVAVTAASGSSSSSSRAAVDRAIGPDSAEAARQVWGWFCLLLPQLLSFFPL